MMRKTQPNALVKFIPNTPKSGVPINVAPGNTKRGVVATSGKRRNRRRGRGANKGRPLQLPTYTLARIDPFNPDVIGVKIPDENQAYALPFQGRQFVSVTTAASGTAGQFFLPDPDNYTVGHSTSVSSGVFTWPVTGYAATAFSNINALHSQFVSSRCVSWGLRVSASQSFTGVSGRVHVCLVGVDMTGTGWNNMIPLSVAAMKAMPGYAYTTLGELIQNDFVAVGRITSATAHHYRSMGSGYIILGNSTASGVESEYGWYGVLVAVEGASAATAVLDIDFIAHYEGIQGAASTVFSNSPPAPHQPQLLAATNNLASSVPPARVTDDAGVQEEGFFAGVGRVWNSIVNITGAVSNAVDFVAEAAASFF